MRSPSSTQVEQGGVRDSVENLLQIIGAILILVAYILAQAGMLDQRSYPYLLLNLVGSAVLAALAWMDRQPGFLLLEGAWAIVSLWSLVGRLRTPGRDAVG